MADSEELSVTVDPLAGGDNDKFVQATFSSPRVSRSWTPLPQFSSNLLRTINTLSVQPISSTMNIYFRSNAQVGVNGF